MREVTTNTGKSGAFHGWGTGFRIIKDIPVPVSVAIVEFDDGSIRTLFPEQITFTTNKQDNDTNT